ncbi:RCK N-terminal domain-containing protein [Sphingomonas antarctica]|uniref:cation:proton antiporter domain-containing protein n=1 Tax=Sphingomonas antarctica TaxID=2040274 RepID=UPI0039E7B1E8
MALDPTATAFSDTLVVLGAAGLVIPAFSRLRVTPVIGFILVGILVGPHGLGSFVDRWPWLFHVSITDPHSLEPFAELGIILLLFSIGLELSFARLWGMRRALFGFGASELFGSALLIALAFLALGNTINASLGLGLALALSSTALVLPIAGTASAVGRLALAMLLFEDLALVPIIFVLGVLGPGGSDSAVLIRTIVGGIAVIAAMFLAGRFVLPKLFGQAARTKSPELFLAASLLVVILASVATLSVGLSPIVGALVAGLLIAETDYAGEVETVVAPFKGLALGVFLITVGMSVDLRALLDDWRITLGAIAAVVAIKAGVTFGLLRLGGVRTGTAAETGLLMASPSETTLIVLATATQAALIRPDAAAFWQVVTAIGLTITPLLATLGNRLSHQIDKGATDDTGEDPAHRTIIVGYGRVGRLIGEMLDAHDKQWLAIEADPEIVFGAGKNVRFGDVARAGILDRFALDRAEALVLTMDDPAQAAKLTRRIRASHPDLTIVARARDPRHAAVLYKAGATDAVPETLESSLQLSEAVLVDLGVAMGPVIASIHEKRDEYRAFIKAEGEMAVAPRLKLRT